MLNKTLIAALAALAIFAAGCGSGDSTTAAATTTGGSAASNAPAQGPALTLDEYNAKMTEISEEGKKSSEAIAKAFQGGGGGDQMKVAAGAMKDAVKLQDDTIAKYKALTPPDDLKKFHATLVEQNEKVRTALVDMQQKAEAGDNTAFMNSAKEMSALAESMGTAMMSELKAAGYDEQTFMTSFKLVKKTS